MMVHVVLRISRPSDGIFVLMNKETDKDDRRSTTFHRMQHPCSNKDMSKGQSRNHLHMSI